MRFHDQTDARRVRLKWVWLPTKCDNGLIVWFERVVIYETCVGFRLPFGSLWETNAIFPESMREEIKTGKYQHPGCIDFSTWEENG